MGKDGMACELLKFRAKDGLKLHGLLVRSRNGNKSVVINVFGMTGDFFSWDLSWELARRLKGTSFDIFFANNRGMGIITAFEKGGKRFSIGTAKERFEECEYDIKGAVDMLHKMGYRNIILQGHSTGCQKTTYYLYKTGDKRVKGLILLAPVDDYNITRKRLGRKFGEAVKYARGMIKKGRMDEALPERFHKHFTAKRFLSFADKRNVEARLFNYDSYLKEFKGIDCKMFVVFGRGEEFATKPVAEHIRILKEATSSKEFDSKIIRDANHNFDGRHENLASEIINWLGGIE